MELTIGLSRALAQLDRNVHDICRLLEFDGNILFAFLRLVDGRWEKLHFFIGRYNFIAGGFEIAHFISAIRLLSYGMVRIHKMLSARSGGEGIHLAACCLFKGQVLEFTTIMVNRTIWFQFLFLDVQIVSRLCGVLACLEILNHLVIGKFDDNIGNASTIFIKAAEVIPNQLLARFVLLDCSRYRFVGGGLDNNFFAKGAHRRTCQKTKLELSGVIQTSLNIVLSLFPRLAGFHREIGLPNRIQIHSGLIACTNSIRNLVFLAVTDIQV